MTSQGMGQGMDAAGTGGPQGNTVPGRLADSQPDNPKNHPDNHSGATESGIDVVLVTGLSGAGRG
ncbi:MAG: hypothetical protein J2P17_22200, partial [Mycobacterium sp.]|nr:hypothetical protein [Mycobacterium sp.]